MGLKDDLIAKAKSGGNSEEPVVDNSFHNSEFDVDESEIDFSSIESEIGVSDPPAFTAPEPEPEIELSSNNGAMMDDSDMYIDADFPVPEPEPFVAQQQPTQQQQIPQQQYYQPQQQAPQQSMSFPSSQSNASFQDILENKEEYRRDSYQDSYEPPARNDMRGYDRSYEQPVVDNYGQSPQSSSYDDGNIKTDLLKLAKKTVLDDISENFSSSIFTKESMQNLINSYLNSKSADYSNTDALFVSLLDEINNNKYNHQYYGELTPDIINAIKGDIVL